MKKTLAFILSLFLISCNNAEKYGMKFYLGDSEKDVIEICEKDNIGFRYNTDTPLIPNSITMEEFDFIYFEGLQFIISSIIFQNDEIVFIDILVPLLSDKESSELLQKYIDDNFGEPQKTKNKDVTYYGNMDGKYAVVKQHKHSNCTTITIADGSKHEELKNVFRRSVYK